MEFKLGSANKIRILKERKIYFSFLVVLVVFGYLILSVQVMKFKNLCKSKAFNLTKRHKTLWITEKNVGYGFANCCKLQLPCANTSVQSQLFYNHE